MQEAPIIDKIRKLLAKASSDNIHESAIFMAKAQELMLKHDLDSVDLKEVKETAIRTDVDNSGTLTLSPLKRYLVNYLEDHYRVKHLLGFDWVPNENSKTGYSKIQKLILIGHKTDIDVFVQVLEYAYRVFDNTFKSYLAERKKKNIEMMLVMTAEEIYSYQNPTRAQSVELKKVYMDGFAKGIDEALTANENQFALAVITPEDVISLTDLLTTGHFKSSITKAYDDEAFDKGFEEGQECLKNRNSLEAKN